MARPYDRQYLHAATSSCGTMQCGGCGKAITAGQYRAAKKSVDGDWAYVTHHRTCCEDDPRWAELDRQEIDASNRAEELRAAAIAFRDKWKIHDLDDLIAELGKPRGLRCDCGELATTKYEGDAMCERCATYCARRDFEESEMPGGFA